MRNQSALSKGAALAATIGLALTLSACKIIKNEPEKQKAEGELEIFFSDDAFNPDKIVAEMWESELLPFADKSAVELSDVLNILNQDRDKAGETYGHREKAEGSPWNYVIKTEAKVVEVNTKSRASTLGLDIPPYDGKTDALLQIGPVIKGTSVRDSLDFVKFDDFTNQLEFARISNSMNAFVKDKILSGLDREALDNVQVTVTGMFTDDGPSKPVLITPVRLSVTDGG